MSKRETTLLIFIVGASWLRADVVLFDTTKHEMGGNADWVIDADAWNQNMPAYPCTGTTNESNPGRYPTPDQSGVTASTAETFWKGGISAWGIELVKAGHTVESLPAGAAITFGDGGNAQDLSNYDLFIVTEPQNPFTAAEKTAILAFVSAGGGLFMVADHETSDRDCDGWDSPHVWNDLTGATSGSAGGLFGIWFRVDEMQNNGSEDWFNDGTDANVETDPADPIINGPFGSGAGGLGFFGATSMDLDTVANASATPHVWRTGQAHDNLRVTFATASYGAGRVAAIGDSSPADDGTGDSGDTLYPGWDKAAGGVNNREIHLNACAWLLNPVPDTTPPVITSGPAAAAGDCAASITWATDEPATSDVDYGTSAAYGQTASTAGLTQNHQVTLSGLTASVTYHYQVRSSDAIGNGPTTSADATFDTAGGGAPVILTGPTVQSVTGASATIVWTTDEPADSTVEYGPTLSYGSSVSSGAFVTSHQLVVSGLTPASDYYFRVLSSDACGNGPTVSAPGTFTTGPAAIDVSGWTLKQFNSTLTYTLPAGTTIPSGGYLVVARDATRAEFEAFYPFMPQATVYLDSNAAGSCANGCLPQVNGAETFELWDATSTLVDGPTIAMAQNNAYQRKNPGDPPGVAGSWNTVAEGEANPGTGAGSGSGAGVRINEMADASDYTKEFVEIYNDGGLGPADTIAPGAITDLAAVAQSTDTVRLTWTAPGDDGSTGTAASYDVRYASSPISTAADFTAATAASGEPAPSVAGTGETFDVTGLTANRTYFFAVMTDDEVPNRSGLSNSPGVTTPTVIGGGGGGADHLVISEIQTNGDGGTPVDDEFVELYNPTGSAVSLVGWSLQYKKDTGTTYLVQSLTGSVPSSIAAGGYILVARSAYNNTSVPANLTNTGFQLGASGGNVYLVQGTSGLSSCSAASVIDRVAWGTGNCPETVKAAAPAANGSIERLPGASDPLCGNGIDTDDNSADFAVRATSDPQNSSSPPESCAAGSSLGNVGHTLFFAAGSKTDLVWSAAFAATGYKVRRSSAAAFMATNPIPDDTYLLASPATTTYADAGTPGAGACFYYFVNATDATSESPEDTPVW